MDQNPSKVLEQRDAGYSLITHTYYYWMQRQAYIYTESNAVISCRTLTILLQAMTPRVVKYPRPTQINHTRFRQMMQLKAKPIAWNCGRPSNTWETLDETMVKRRQQRRPRRPDQPTTLSGIHLEGTAAPVCTPIRGWWLPDHQLDHMSYRTVHDGDRTLKLKPFFERRWWWMNITKLDSENIDQAYFCI